MHARLRVSDRVLRPHQHHLVVGSLHSDCHAAGVDAITRGIELADPARDRPKRSLQQGERRDIGLISTDDVAVDLEHRIRTQREIAAVVEGQLHFAALCRVDPVALLQPVPALQRESTASRAAQRDCAHHQVGGTDR